LRGDWPRGLLTNQPGSASNNKYLGIFYFLPLQKIFDGLNSTVFLKKEWTFEIFFSRLIFLKRLMILAFKKEISISFTST
jgi:hypothetical protein